MIDRNPRVALTAARNWGVRIVLALVAILAAYAVAGYAGGAIPANRDWQPPERGIEIFVESNGVHTGVVVPKIAAGIDWRGVARPEHLADPRYARYDHLSFGWGERTFYLETPNWADLKIATVLAAAFGSDATLVHIDHVPRPVPGADVRRIVLRPDEYRRLAAFIRASFARSGVRHRGYFGYDAFYTGAGRYDAVRTCNAWTGEALRAAGVRVGVWTPFPATVLWWF